MRKLIIKLKHILKFWLTTYLLQTTKPHHHQGGPPRIWSHHTPIPLNRKVIKLS